MGGSGGVRDSEIRDVYKDASVGADAGDGANTNVRRLLSSTKNYVSGGLG